jgi:V/A-type H+-transporting ATPase subunit I
LLKTRTMTKARIYFHEQYADDVFLKVAETGTLHQTDVLESLRGLEPQIRPVEPSEKLFRVTALISRMQAVISNLSPISVRTPKVDLRVLTGEDIETIDREFSSVEQVYSSVTLRLTDAEEDKKTQAKEELSKLLRDHEEKLLRWSQHLEITRVVEEAKSKSARTSRTYVIEGWIPVERKNDFEEAVRQGSEGYCATLYLSPSTAGGHGHAEVEPPPTLIRNPRMAYVYEKLVTGFGLPNYFEVDPTIFMIISFPIIFGLMFADVGHGLILLMFSLLLVAINRRGVRAPELFEYMIKGSPLLVMCSISAVFFGFIEGELFGSEKYYHILDGFLHETLGVSILETVRSASHTIEAALSAVAGFSIPIPFPFSPFEKPMALLLVSLYVAIIQITFGLVLGLVNQLRKRNYLEAIVGPSLWLWFYLSCAYLFLRYKSGILSIVFQRGDILGLYIALPAIIMILARTALHGMDGFGHSLESLISSLSNSISYGRILALALTHGAFSRILLMFLGLQETALAIVGGVMWVFLTFLLILCFEGLLSFIQTLRLHWVEWFLKFYSGDGYAYKPLRF